MMSDAAVERKLRSSQIFENWVFMGNTRIEVYRIWKNKFFDKIFSAELKNNS